MSRPSPSRAQSLWLGGIAVLLALGALVVGLFGGDAGRSAVDGRGEPDPASRPGATELAPLDGSSVPEPEPARAAVARPETPAGERTLPSSVPPEAANVHGRVLREDGTPLAGVWLACGAESTHGVVSSDSEGRFACGEPLPAGCLLRIATSGYLTLSGARVRRDADQEAVVVGAPALSLSGVVREVSGEGIADARVTVEAAESGLRRLRELGGSESAARALLDGLAETTREGGGFLLVAPSWPGARLVVRMAGYFDACFLLPAASRSGLDVVLQRLRGAVPAGVQGRVVAEGGGPVEGASVRLGDALTTSDARGEFRLAWQRMQPDDALWATKAGFRPAILPDFGARVAAGGDAPLWIELVLGSGAAPITGTLVAADGTPLEGWRIKLKDGTLVSRVAPEPLYAEVPDAPGGARRTGAGGRFEFADLDPGRSYRLRAWSPETLEIAESDAIPAGTRDYVFRVPEPGFRTVEGRVVGLDGLPLAEIRIRLTMSVHEAEGGTWMHTGQEVRTGEDGAFLFEDVPRCPLFLRFNGDDVSSKRVDLAPSDPGGGLVVELLRTGAFVLEPPPGGLSGAELRVLDRGGQPLRMSFESGPGTTRSGTHVPVDDVGTSPVTVSEEAAWLVVAREGAEVARVPLSVRHGALTRVPL